MTTLKWIEATSIGVFMAAVLGACGARETGEPGAAEAAAEETTDAGEAGADADAGEDPSGEDEGDNDEPLEDARATPGAGGEASRETTGRLASLSAMSLGDVRSKDDIALAAEASFTRADANGDGYLDLAEFAEMSGIRIEKGAGVVEATGKVDNALGDAAGIVQNAMIDQTFALGAGVDDQMTKDELREVFLARFEEADTDDNGELDDDERVMFATPTAPEKIDNQ